MSLINMKAWGPIIIVFLAGSLATALVPQTVPILGAIGETFNVDRHSLGWIVSLPTVACALGALAFGVVVDRAGDVRILLIGVVLVVLGDAGVSLAPELNWLIAARLFQGLGYICITVAAPTFIQRVTSGDMRRAAMAFWAAHTPLGFAAAVFLGAQFVAAGVSWRWSFLPHAIAALVIGLLALSLGRAATASKISRSAGTKQVLTSPRAYAVALGAAASGMLQVSVMVLIPSLMKDGHGLTGSQSALVVVAAMLVNWLGAMLIVATRLRNMPQIVLPISAVVSALFGFLIVTGVVADLSAKLAVIMVFTASIGIANALIWSLLPAAVPSPEAGGATAGLVTQGSFLGVLLGPPTFFWIRHESTALMGVLALVLVGLMLIPLFAHAAVRRAGGLQAAH